MRNSKSCSSGDRTLFWQRWQRAIGRRAGAWGKLGGRAIDERHLEYVRWRAQENSIEANELLLIDATEYLHMKKSIWQRRTEKKNENEKL